MRPLLAYQIEECAQLVPAYQHVAHDLVRSALERARQRHAADAAREPELAEDVWPPASCDHAGPSQCTCGDDVDGDDDERDRGYEAAHSAERLG